MNGAWSIEPETTEGADSAEWRGYKDLACMLLMAHKIFAAVAAGAALAAGLSVLPASAQMAMTEVRAANLARMEAERLNGGLSKYFAANCMHQKGGGDCMVNAGPNGYLFNFAGGPPGWEVNKQAATKETRILISPDGTSVVNVEYNGSPR
jgi:hypothetical protein